MGKGAREDTVNFGFDQEFWQQVLWFCLMVHVAFLWSMQTFEVMVVMSWLLLTCSAVPRFCLQQLCLHVFGSYRCIGQAKYSTPLLQWYALVSRTSHGGLQFVFV